MPIALLSEVEIAKVEHIPRNKPKTGLFSIKQLLKSFHIILTP